MRMISSVRAVVLECLVMMLKVLVFQLISGGSICCMSGLRARIVASAGMISCSKTTGGCKYSSTRIVFSVREMDNIQSGNGLIE